MAGRSPKLGERAYARSPNFGYSFDFREVLIIDEIYRLKGNVVNGKPF